MPRRSILGAFSLPAITLLAACGGPVGNRSDDPSAVTVLYDADERLFGPALPGESQFLMFLSLAGHDEAGNVVGRLARSWEHSPDFRRWIFHLRPDVLWHDGRPFTADDIRFSIELMAHPELRIHPASSDLDSMRVHDDTTLAFHFRQPFNAVDTWTVYWPRHHLEDLDPKAFYEWEFWTQPVGNGPYRYVRHVPKTMVELSANPDFYAGKPAIERVRIKFGAELGLAELLSGNVDVLTRVNSADLSKLGREEQFKVYRHLWPEMPWFFAVFWNHETPALGDPEVRMALTHAIDRRELMRLLNLPEEYRITDVPFTGRQYRRGEIPAPLAYDTAQAVALLEQKGWLRAGKDSVRQRNGQALEFTTLLGSGGVEEQAAVFVQESLRRIGVDMRIQPLDFGALAGSIRSGEYDAFFLPYFNHVEGHLGYLSGNEYQRPTDLWTPAVLGYENAEVTRLLVSIQATVDTAAIDSMYLELAPLILADLPVTYLFPMDETAVVRRNIRGLRSPYRANPIQYMEALWLEEGR